MGLLLTIYRPAGREEWQNDDASSRLEMLTAVNVDGPFQPSAAAPGYRLVQHDWYPDFCFLEPIERHHGAGPSGNFAGSVDSRWLDATKQLVGHKIQLVPIYDRFEEAF